MHVLVIQGRLQRKKFHALKLSESISLFWVVIGHIFLIHWKQSSVRGMLSLVKSGPAFLTWNALLCTKMWTISESSPVSMACNTLLCMRMWTTSESSLPPSTVHEYADWINLVLLHWLEAFYCAQIDGLHQDRCPGRDFPPQPPERLHSVSRMGLYTTWASWS